MSRRSFSSTNNLVIAIIFLSLFILPSCIRNISSSKSEGLIIPEGTNPISRDSLRKVLSLSRYNEIITTRQSSILDFTSIDDHSIMVPAEARSDVKTLSGYLVKPAKNEWEKVRAIYTWIINNVDYDLRVDRGYEVSEDPAVVLKTGLAVCSGFSNVFSELAKQAGFEVETLIGYSKDSSNLALNDIDKIYHVWNAVKIQKKWHLFDATWGAGSIRNGLYFKNTEYFWFDTPPEEFIFSHIPQDPLWQLIEEPISLSDFKKLPELPKQYFKFGFNGVEALTCLGADLVFDFPTIYDGGSFKVKLIKAPLYGVLNKGETYYFLFFANGSNEMMIKNGGVKTIIKAKNGYFASLVKAKSGDLDFYLSKPESNRYSAFIGYKVL